MKKLEINSLRDILNQVEQKIFLWIFYIFTENWLTHSFDNSFTSSLSKLIIDIPIKKLEETEIGTLIQNSKENLFIFGCDINNNFELEDFNHFSYLYLQFLILFKIDCIDFRKLLETRKIVDGEVITLIHQHKNNDKIYNIREWFDFCYTIKKKIISKEDYGTFCKDTNLIKSIIREYSQLPFWKNYIVPKEFIHSDYYRTVKYMGSQYKLSIVQASVITYMHKLFLSGLSEIKGEEILTHLENDFSENYKRVRDIFKNSPLWNKLIKQSSENRGYYFLDI